ncbi:type II toxin-antitoxin system HipA family toxin [Campylobacter showae]|uniref:type II toxin-antitoxin system HipA family toxin n=1 Tax=Campylobacter showae TaxID=204 RepID=UPI000F08B5A9|nr:type II toxin-antitoxin system HipA family toxin [Campylobacter showae]
MNQVALEIVKILKNSKALLARTQIEKGVERASRRTVQNELKKLSELRRIRVAGQASSTAYEISNEYSYFKNRLFIYQNQILIGYFGYDYENYYFVYDTDFLLSGRYGVKFEMPIDFKIYTSKSCFVDFEESLPEGIDKKILIDKAGNATEFFLLLHNDYSKNDLVFSASALEFNREIKPQSYLSQKDKILGVNTFPNILKYDVDIDDVSLFPGKFMSDSEEIKHIRTMSLSGYQHKLQVIVENNAIKVASDKDNATFFIKPYDTFKADENSDYYFPHIAINEHLHMSFAKNELGFDVPMSGVFKRDQDKEYHYFIKYFDRIGAYKFQRKEFSTFMGLSSESKYKASSEKLFDAAARILPSSDDRLRMIEYYFYSFLIRHEDMHTKNISVIYDNGKILLAPLYDIACTGFYKGIKNYESHLSINGKQTNIRYSDFIEIVKRANVDRAKFNESAKNIVEIYIKKMPKYIKKLEKLDRLDFYKKDRVNAEDKRVKIKSKTTLAEVMMEHFEQRCETLKRNGWFEKWGIKI